MRIPSRVLPLYLLAAACVMMCGCRGVVGDPLDPATAAALRGKVKHVIFMVQENRSFDHYFGQLGQYREANGYGAASDIDRLPSTAAVPDLQGDQLQPYHLDTTCLEELSAAWMESHVDVNMNDPGSSTALMNGFVVNAAKYAQANNERDTNGVRAIGYYDSSDLPFYYFMASNFATSDRWFSPLQAESIPNRIFLQAGTTAGHVHPPDTTNGQCCDNLPTIFHRLQDAGISWKIYYTDTQANGAPLTDLNNYWPKFASAHAENIVPISQYYQDLTYQQLPAVAFIQAGLASGRDEHPGGQESPGQGGNDVQKGAFYTWQIISELMKSAMWKDSVFILTFDEGGSFYDHVAPAPAQKPDGIDPIDLNSDDAVIKPQATFDHTGFRIPLMVISPFTKKSYVSHTTADSTAILSFIEARFGLPPLSNRDATQMNMTEFFDFNNPPWMTPPVPPQQPIAGKCDPTNLPTPAALAP